MPAYGGGMEIFMKRFFGTVLTVILVVAILAGIAYAIDLGRMNEGKPVMFSTWGMDYAPTEEAPEPEVEPNTDEPKDEKPKEIEVSLFFADENIAHLKSEKRVFKNDETIAKEVVQAIIDGPQNENLCTLIPSDTEIISASVSGDLCTINLNDEFTNFTGGTSMENLAIFSIVNSLCSVDGISKVKIDIEGNKNAMFGGHYSLEDVFTKDMSLVK